MDDHVCFSSIEEGPQCREMVNRDAASQCFSCYKYSLPPPDYGFYFPKEHKSIGISHFTWSGLTLLFFLLWKVRSNYCQTTEPTILLVAPRCREEVSLGMKVKLLHHVLQGLEHVSNLLACRTSLCIFISLFAAGALCTGHLWHAWNEHLLW